MQTKQQLGKQNIRRQLFSLATELLPDQSAAVVSYLALDAFSRNPSLVPDTWRQQRVLSWTPPSVTFNRQIEVALEEARLRQSRKVQPQVSDTVNPFDISF